MAASKFWHGWQISLGAAAKAERFFHDVSRYGRDPVAPSKISTTIIWPP